MRKGPPKLNLGPQRPIYINALESRLNEIPIPKIKNFSFFFFVGVVAKNAKSFNIGQGLAECFCMGHQLIDIFFFGPTF